MTALIWILVIWSIPIAIYLFMAGWLGNKVSDGFFIIAIWPISLVMLAIFAPFLLAYLLGAKLSDRNKNRNEEVDDTQH